MPIIIVIIKSAKPVNHASHLLWLYLLLRYSRVVWSIRVIIKPSENTINTSKLIEKIINENFNEEYIKVAAVESPDYSNEPSADEGYENEDCNVAGVNLHGQILTYVPQQESPEFVDVIPADYISYYIKKAIKNTALIKPIELNNLD